MKSGYKSVENGRLITQFKSGNRRQRQNFHPIITYALKRNPHYNFYFKLFLLILHKKLHPRGTEMSNLIIVIGNIEIIVRNNFCELIIISGVLTRTIGLHVPFFSRSG